MMLRGAGTFGFFIASMPSVGCRDILPPPHICVSCRLSCFESRRIVYDSAIFYLWLDVNLPSVYP